MCNKTWKRVQLKLFHDMKEFWHRNAFCIRLWKRSIFSVQFVTVTNFWRFGRSIFPLVWFWQCMQGPSTYPLGPVSIFDKTSYCYCRYKILERWHFHWNRPLAYKWSRHSSGLAPGINTKSEIYHSDCFIFSGCIDGWSLQWRHNGRDSVSNHQPQDCLLNRLFRRRSEKTSKLRVTGLCEGNSPGTGEFPTQRTSNTENASIWWRRHVLWRPFLLQGYSVAYHGASWTYPRILSEISCRYSMQTNNG